MKHRVRSLLSAVAMSLSLCATTALASPVSQGASIEDDVTGLIRHLPVPVVTKAPEKVPSVALLIGNSYSFYNCGVHTYLRDLMQASTPQIGMKTRLLTISSGSLTFHDVKHYLSPHELDPYGDTKDGALTHPMFDVVIMQGHSAAATSEKRIPVFKRMVSEHAKTIREAGSEPLLVMTWPKENKPGELDKLAKNTIEAANDAKIRVVPVGLAWAVAQRALPEVKFYMPDHSHPTAAGTYLYAATLYAVLFHRPMSDLDVLGGCEKPLSPEVAKTLRDVAWETVQVFER